MILDALLGGPGCHASWVRCHRLKMKMEESDQIYDCDHGIWVSGQGEACQPGYVRQGFLGFPKAFGTMKFTHPYPTRQPTTRC